MTNSIISNSVTTTKPAIFVVCLASYTNGELHGEWIDATQGFDDVKAEIQAMLANSPEEDAEEWAIFDSNDFAGYEVDEYADIETVCQIACLIEEHGPVVVNLFYDCGDTDEVQTALNERYRGEWDSELDYARELFDDCYASGLTECLQRYINYDAFARDLFINDCTSYDVHGKVHVFDNY